MSRKISPIIYIPPLLALIVGGLHFYLIDTQNLSPWRLGGFGVFSEISDHATRLVKAYAVIEGTLVPIDLADDVKGRIQTLPNEDALRQLLVTLSCSNDDYPDAEDVVLEFWLVDYQQSARRLVPELVWKESRATAIC